MRKLYEEKEVLFAVLWIVAYCLVFGTIKGSYGYDSPLAAAVIVSSLTFGIGHIVNFLTGQAGFETAVQIVFAVSLGFVFTMVYYKSGSLIPCIIAHSLIDVFALFTTDSIVADWIYVGAAVVVSIIYCIFLSKVDSEKQK